VRAIRQIGLLVVQVRQNRAEGHYHRIAAQNHCRGSRDGGERSTPILQQDPCGRKTDQNVGDVDDVADVGGGVVVDVVGGGGGGGNTALNGGTGAVGANGQIQIAYGVTTLNYTQAQANATTGVQVPSSYIINTTLLQVNVSASVGVVTANSFNAVTTPQALATTGFGIVTPIIPLNNPTAPRASVFASAGVVTTGTFIPSYPTQALATTGVGSLTPKASIQNIPISGVVATTSSIPLGGDILIIGFDIQMTIDGGMSITLGSGVNMVIGGL